MKVRASVKKRSAECVLSYAEKADCTLLTKRILDLNKDKDNYGKNRRGRYT
jgi:hypothetical protein